MPLAEQEQNQRAADALRRAAQAAENAEESLQRGDADAMRYKRDGEWLTEERYRLDVQTDAALAFLTSSGRLPARGV